MDSSMVIMEALYYKKNTDGRVECLLCPNFCVIAPEKTGRCRLRRNENGTLEALSYGNTVTLAVDPIEKKPLYHFLPGSRILSMGPNGCTLECDHCQNWNISQKESPVTFVPPEKLAGLARESGSAGVAFTYTEPLLWIEYLLDAAPMLAAEGLKSVVVTNGYINEEPGRRIAGEIDAFNIDLKSFDDGFYRKYCGGSVEPVKRFIATACGSSHVEVTTLVIPGLNDSPEEIEALARWLSGISRDIPLHLSRFFPRHRMSGREPTSEDVLRRSHGIARRFLDYVYIGNIFIEGTESTFCPGCGEEVVTRAGYKIRIHGTAGACPRCGTGIKGVWD